MLSADYNDKQRALKDAIPVKEGKLQKLIGSDSNMDAFIEKVESTH